jgi:UDP-2,3-diacylglucosamine pyrophosphatase LpxH
VKNAVSYITAFEEAIAREARERGLDGVVCGHIHKAEIRDIGGVVYCNDGDWVESLTALVETAAGDLKILHWHDVTTSPVAGDFDEPNEESSDAHPDRDRRVVAAG